MKRREFITLFGGTALAWPLDARAQQRGKIATVGFLGAGSLSVYSEWIGAFAQRSHCKFGPVRRGPLPKIVYKDRWGQAWDGT
jgi:hypothetical protein